MPLDHHTPVATPVATSVARLGLLVCGEAGAVVALVAAGTRPPVAGAPWLRGFPHWFTTDTPVDALVVVTHRVALVVATWLLATTVLHLAAALTRVPALVRASAWAAMPGARRAVAAVVVTAGVLVPTAAQAATGDATGGTTTAQVRDGRAGTVHGAIDAAAGMVPPSPGPSASAVTPRVAPPVTPPGPVRAPRTVVVRAGDSLWTIAAEVAATEQERPAEAVPVADVAARWLAIRDANGTRLRSGDESLIFPGEEIVVPE
jgi:hypothetical protein